MARSDSKDAHDGNQVEQDTSRRASTAKRGIPKLVRIQVTATRPTRKTMKMSHEQAGHGLPKRALSGCDKDCRGGPGWP